jgi:hypothetical protein
VFFRVFVVFRAFVPVSVAGLERPRSREDPTRAVLLSHGTKSSRWLLPLKPARLLRGVIVPPFGMDTIPNWRSADSQQDVRATSGDIAQRASSGQLLRCKLTENGDRPLCRDCETLAGSAHRVGAIGAVSTRRAA